MLNFAVGDVLVTRCRRSRLGSYFCLLLVAVPSGGFVPRHSHNPNSQFAAARTPWISASFVFVPVRIPGRSGLVAEGSGLRIWIVVAPWSGVKEEMPCGRENLFLNLDWF